jgi:hypothetical protein
MDNKKINSFLNDLTRLSIKYNLYIGGCGCCGSPFISEDSESNYLYDNLEYDYELKKYKVEDYG